MLKQKSRESPVGWQIIVLVAILVAVCVVGLLAYQKNLGNEEPQAPGPSASVQALEGTLGASELG